MIPKYTMFYDVILALYAYYIYDFSPQKVIKQGEFYRRGKWSIEALIMDTK
jgi:hypothetical protein